MTFLSNLECFSLFTVSGTGHVNFRILPADMATWHRAELNIFPPERDLCVALGITIQATSSQPYLPVSTLIDAPRQMGAQLAMLQEDVSRWLGNCAC